MRFTKKSWLALCVSMFLFIGCSEPSTEIPISKVEHPEWSKNASIYEVNIRQYTPEGTFNAFREDLPRLQAMGVDILWLMPIHPIGEETEKVRLVVTMQ